MGALARGRRGRAYVRVQAGHAAVVAVPHEDGVLSMRSRGKAFEEEMRKSIEACGGLVVRIPDAMAFDRQRKVMVGAKTPADFIMVYTRSGRGGGHVPARVQGERIPAGSSSPR